MEGRGGAKWEDVLLFIIIHFTTFQIYHAGRRMIDMVGEYSFVVFFSFSNNLRFLDQIFFWLGVIRPFQSVFFCGEWAYRFD